MKERTKRIIQRTCSILWWAVFILLFALIVSVVTAKAKGETPKVFGYSVIKIMTPSMEDTLPVGSYILIQETAPEQIKKNDIITFYSEDPSIYGRLNTHKVVEDPIAVAGGYEYVTKGDANLINDPVPAKSQNLVGRYVTKLDWLTVLSEAVQTSSMMVIFIGVQALSMGILIVVVVLKNKKQQS